jgi:hypothetical protein
MSIITLIFRGKMKAENPISSQWGSELSTLRLISGEAVEIADAQLSKNT